MQQVIHTAHKALLLPLREALYNYDANQLQRVARHAYDYYRRWLARHRAGGAGDHHAQPGFLAMGA